ncbi:hypothetical protein WKT22_03373 [Candidatus Lokiarchaeum ossiferum]
MELDPFVLKSKEFQLNILMITMSTIKTGSYSISNLADSKKINVLNQLQENILNRVAYLIQFLEKKSPILKEKYVNSLLDKISMDKSIISYNITPIFQKFPVLENFPLLVEQVIGRTLEILNIPVRIMDLNTEVETTNRANIRSYLIFRYYNVQSIIESTDRVRGISLYKEFVTEYVKSFAPQNPPIKSLEEFRSATIQSNKKKPNIGWVILQGKIQDGKFPQRKDTCMWKDAIQDLPDQELKYLVACYGDFQGYNNSNPAFRLTMEHTIMEGDPYCSCCLHDTRITGNLTHPSREFYDSMKEGI